jgi:hypothetical protein
MAIQVGFTSTPGGAKLSTAVAGGLDATPIPPAVIDGDGTHSYHASFSPGGAVFAGNLVASMPLPRRQWAIATTPKHSAQTKGLL